MGKKDGPIRLLGLQPARHTDVSFSLSISLPLPHLEWGMAHRFTAGGDWWHKWWWWWGEGGAHMRLACPWKLMVRGSFALDMSSLGIGAMVGSLAMHKESGTTSLSPNLASRVHQAWGKISPWSYLVFDCQTVCNQQASTCSNLDKSTLSDRAGLWIKQQPGKWRGESVASLAGSVLLPALWTLSALIIAVYAVSHLISSYTL